MLGGVSMNVKTGVIWILGLFGCAIASVIGSRALLIEVEAVPYPVMVNSTWSDGLLLLTGLFLGIMVAIFAILRGEELNRIEAKLKEAE